MGGMPLLLDNIQDIEDDKQLLPASILVWECHTWSKLMTRLF